MDTINEVDSLEFEMDETEYLCSSPAMIKIIEEGRKAIKEGDYVKINLNDLWK